MVATKVPVHVQKRSGFQKSHHNALTQKVGTAVPVLIDEVIPNSKIHLRYAMAGSMPPLATDTYMKCYYDVRAFFVPFRLLYGGFESWFTDYAYPVVANVGGANAISNTKCEMPYLSIDPTVDFSTMLGAGTLADYLGYKIDYTSLGSLDQNLVFSVLPFLCYHRVMSDWFRQPNITKEYFARPSSYSGPSTPEKYCCAFLPFVGFDANNCVINVPSGGDKYYQNLLLADGKSIFDLRQVNYDYDYFTNAQPSAQLGSAMVVQSASNFSIPALRYANSLQQFAELNAIASSNLVDSVYARYGAKLSRGVAQKCVYLGGARLNLGTRSVDITGNANSTMTQNPFKNSVGASGGKVYCQGTDVIIDGFTADEPGYIMVIGAVIPKVTYGTGIRRYFKHYCGSGSIVDLANPLLQNIGNQPIWDFELTGSIGSSTDETSIFGYTDRYAEFMSMEDEVHGLMQFGQSLESFIAQRYFLIGDSPVISTNFLEIPTTALDSVSAVSGDVSQYGFFGQFAFDYRVSQPLAQYSLPSLQNPAYEHGHEITVHRGGFRF